jgi:anti-sigma-K factor RskA
MSGDPIRPGAAEGCDGNAAPYVLGALTDAEHEAFLLHMGSCAVCREEVASLQSVVAALPAAAPRLKAPRELKRKLMAEVAEDARRQDAAERAAASPRASQRRWRVSFRPVFAAPLAAGLAAIVVLAIALSGGGGSAPAKVIRAEVTAPGASAYVTVSDEHANLTVSKFPPTRIGQVYEVWVKRAGNPEPTDALFDVTSRGEATVEVPGSVRGVRDVLVTAEPDGGVSVPTSTPTIVAHLE